MQSRIRPSQWPRSSRRVNVKGFTLVELMVTISVLAILLAIAIPSFSGAIARNAVAGHVNGFIGDARYARTEAIKRGANVTMCRTDNPEAAAPACNIVVAAIPPAVTKNSDWSGGWLIFVDTDNDGAYKTASSDILLRVQPAQDRSGGMTSTVTYDYFTYNAIGKVSNNGTITASPKGSLSGESEYQRRLKIDTVGRIRWCKASDGIIICPA